MSPDPLVIPWQGRQLRIRHDDPRLKPYSPQASRLRSQRRHQRIAIILA